MHRLVSVIALAAMIVAASRSASALPVFARRYGMSCTTCHSGGPTVLNEFGEAFRDNGYRIPGNDASYVQVPPVALGAPARASLFPNTVWPGEIPGQVPLAISGLVGVEYARPTVGAPTFDTPVTVRVLLGASLGEHFSVFGALSFYDSLQLEQLFLVGRGILGRELGEMALNVKVGLITPDILALQPTLRRAITLPYSLSQPIGSDGYTLATSSPGLELYGVLLGRIKWVVGVVNGVKPLDDVRARRDFFARASVTIGGPRRDLLSATSDRARGPSLALGGLIYAGVATVAPGPSDAFARYSNEILRVGGDARLRAFGFDVMAQVIVGHDTSASPSGDRVIHCAWNIEAEYRVFPWLVPYARYEELRFDSATHSDQRRIVAGTAAFIRANVRVRLEGVLGLTAADPSVVSADLFLAM